MSRIYGSLAVVIFLSLTLSTTARATPIAGAGFAQSHAFHGNAGEVFNSSIASGGIQQHLSLATASNSSLHFDGIAPHQFSLRVPPPNESETPEPSTLTLFGSGLMMVAGAARRKFRR
jgi:hypothetical protein